jgi:hypothetical protein
MITKALNVLMISTVLLAAPLLASTNTFYITDERKWHPEDRISFKPEQIEEAKHAKDSRPSEEDSEGNWGPVSEGFQLSIRLHADSFTNGQPVKACVIVRNVTDKALSYLASPYVDTSDIDFVVMRGTDRIRRNDEPRDGTFLERVRGLRVGSRGLLLSPARTQRKFFIDLTKNFNLTTNGEYQVHATREMPTLDRASETNIVSGVASFRIVGHRQQTGPY